MLKEKRKKRKDHALCQIKYWARNEKREIDLSPVICKFSELGSEGKEMIGPRTSFFFFLCGQSSAVPLALRRMAKEKVLIMH